MLYKIISGCQTGADEAGLEVALEFGLQTGGWMPLGYLTEEGIRDDLAEKYGLEECLTPGYPARTFKNVADSDGTIRFARSFSSPGERCTLEAINTYGKPHFDVNMRRPRPVEEVVAWLAEKSIRVLNVAGNRESTTRGIMLFTMEYLRRVLSQAALTKES